MDLNTLSTAFLARATLTPGTLRDYSRLLGLAAAHLPGPVEAITPHHVQGAVAALQERLGPKSRRNLVAVLRSVLRSVGSTAADGIRCRVPEAPSRALSPDEASRLRAALQLHGEYGLLLVLATGVRLGEYLGLREGDFLADRKVLRVFSPKVGKWREVDVPDWALDCVRLPVRDCPRRLRRALARACRAAGVPQVRVHDLRHTRLTGLLLAGAPVLYASQQAGHASPAFTMKVYGHLAAAPPEQRRAWANS